jgi:hypothetical protein
MVISSPASATKPFIGSTSVLSSQANKNNVKLRILINLNKFLIIISVHYLN